MRWYWVDRVTEFESGRRARAIKHVSLSEDHLHDHFPAYPIMPASLIVEGMGQTGMLLACEAIEYSHMILLAKIVSARFYFDAVPGDTLIYTATINSIKEEGVFVAATSHRNDRLQGEAELIFSRFSAREPDGDSALILSVVKMARILGVFAIGRTADGRRLPLPAVLGRSKRNPRQDKS